MSMRTQDAVTLSIRQMAALFFAGVSHPVELAARMGISVRTVHRYASRPEWDAALDNLGFVGDRKFTKYAPGRKPRDFGEQMSEQGDQLERVFGEDSNTREDVSCMK